MTLSRTLVALALSATLAAPALAGGMGALPDLPRLTFPAPAAPLGGPADAGALALSTGR